jgi:hypothetical protein
MRIGRRGAVAGAVLVVGAAVAAGVVSVAQAGGVRLEPAWPADGAAVAERTPTIRVKVSDPTAVERYEVRVDGRPAGSHVQSDGESLVISGLALADGRHDVSVSAATNGFLRGDAEIAWSFDVDTRAPELALEPVASGWTRKRTVVLRGTTEPGADVRVGIDQTFGDPVSADDAGAFTIAAEAPEGETALVVRARDAAGNETSAGRTVRIDRRAPRIRFDLAGRVDDATPVLAADVRDASPLDVRATVDGDAVMLGAEPALPLAEGRHTLAVSATDAVGRETTAETRFLVDSTERFGSTTLVRGARGDDVRELQRRLRREGFLLAAPTGVFAGGTHAAVLAFQRARSLPADGVVGPMTTGALSGRIVIDQSDHLLTLYRPGQATLQFPVAVGQSAYPTPTGDFTVITMVRDPTWVPPDAEWAQGALPVPPGPDNPLGTRWIGISAPAVGIHGTPDPESIGYSVSHGCIRMRIPDVELVFELVSIGTPVHIQA